jgi:hypothetical protein
MHLTNVFGLPDAIYNAVKNDPYQGGGDISVTKLIDAPQRRTLYKRHRELVVEDVSERLWSLLGQAVHTILERAGTNALAEERLYADVDGWKLSGQFDRLHLGDGVLQDYKVCSTFKADGDAGWERQLNVLRWLAHKNNYPVESLQIVALFRDWRSSEAKRNPDYPQQAMKIIPVRTWTLDEAESYIRERVAMHRKSEAGESVECSEDERWYSGTTYALMKDGGKRAKRVFEIKPDTSEVPDGHYIQERPGMNRRCEEYCEVAPFCEQFKAIKDQTGQESKDDVDF